MLQIYDNRSNRVLQLSKRSLLQPPRQFLFQSARPLHSESLIDLTLIGIPLFGGRFPLSIPGVRLAFFLGCLTLLAPKASRRALLGALALSGAGERGDEGDGWRGLRCLVVRVGGGTGGRKEVRAVLVSVPCSNSR
jgi:hypothetical protein